MQITSNQNQVYFTIKVENLQTVSPANSLANLSTKNISDMQYMGKDLRLYFLKCLLYTVLSSLSNAE